MPREAPRETESRPKTSPSARSAAKSVALGSFRDTWQVRLPRGAPREKDSGGAPSPLGCSAPRVSQNGPRAKASPFGEFSLGMFCAARVTGRPEGESPVIRRFSLGLFRGVGRLPWLVHVAPGRRACAARLQRPHRLDIARVSIVQITPQELPRAVAVSDMRRLVRHRNNILELSACPALDDTTKGSL